MLYRVMDIQSSKMNVCNDAKSYLYVVWPDGIKFPAEKVMFAVTSY